MNIKQILRNVLMTPEIINLTANKKVFLLDATNAAPPYVVYTIIDEWGADFAENEEIETAYSIQVDVFAKGDYAELEDKIKKVMTGNGFCRTSAFDFYEDNTGLYHKALRFNFTKNKLEV